MLMLLLGDLIADTYPQVKVPTGCCEVVLLISENSTIDYEGGLNPNNSILPDTASSDTPLRASQKLGAFN